MLLATLLCQWRAAWFIQLFTSEPAVVAVGETYLRIISWNFVAVGLVFTCSSTFQGLGNTWPSLLSSGSRLVTFALPAIWMSRQPWFRLEHLWYLSVVTVALQALTSFWLLRTQFRTRLVQPDPDAATLAGRPA